MFPRQNAFSHWQIVSIARACPGAAECDSIPGCSSILSQTDRSPGPEQRRSATDRLNFAKRSRSEPALSTHDECPVSRQVQPGNVESDQRLALQCAANFGLDGNYDASEFQVWGDIPPTGHEVSGAQNDPTEALFGHPLKQIDITTTHLVTAEASRVPSDSVRR